MSSEHSDERFRTVRVSATGETQARTTATVRGHEVVLDEPESMGGTDEGPNPVEYQLAALAGCLNVTTHQVARERDIEVESFAVDVAGDFDPDVFAGRTDEGRAGLVEVRADVDVVTDAGSEELRELFEAVERRCPISDSLVGESSLVLEVTSR
jgi:uncharacterized OsmC-like protein